LSFFRLDHLKAQRVRRVRWRATLSIFARFFAIKIAKKWPV
jgi:hypothetical protein